MNNRMGCAAILRDSQGAWVSAVFVSFEQGNPFLAELLGIECGLDHVWELMMRTANVHRIALMRLRCLSTTNVFYF